ncbi:LysM peptidoglycan-binding domain-containing protein [Kribbella sp. NPDC051718]|uniref:LysM peptidoglycan-binding domain-containing protein n=1 Tax=Kribbella sp. NPDC051718 TaxID=3155168 RepID=UPI00341436A0
MKTTIRGLKGLIALGALAGLGLLLHWVTAGSIEAATTQDLTSMASLAIGAVAWPAYCWLAVAVLATVLEQLPGAVGRGASLVATQITSQGSRALLRSALGVAAVTPLTIGLAHATPTHPVTPQSGAGSTPTAGTTSTSRPSLRAWTSPEPASTLEITNNPIAGHPVASGGSGSAKPQSTRPQTTSAAKTPPGSRPWSSVEPSSTVEVSDGTPTNWRAPEKQSSVQLGAPTAPASPSHPNATRPHQPAPRPTTPPAQPPTRSDRAPRKQSPTAPTAAPDQTDHTTPGRTEAPNPKHPATARTDVLDPRRTTTGHTGAPGPKHPTAGRTGVPDTKRATTGRTGGAVVGRGGVSGGEIAVPDRPTSGAPTRYTHLQSGRLARAASHVVKAGDSLWSIAAAELGPDATTDAIAARWPQWYEANRHQIGPNPNLIHPGQVLTPPPPSHPVPPTHQEK